MINRKWNSLRAAFPVNSYSLDIWHGCLQSLRKFLRGWNLKEIGKQKIVKMDMSKRIVEIDSLAEHRLLTLDEWEQRIELENKLEDLSRLEDLQWKQKAGKNRVLHGDANTHFFHQFVNGRRRKKQITYLDSDMGEIRGQGNISNHILDFYKQLFGHNLPCSMHLGGGGLLASRVKIK